METLRRAVRNLAAQLGSQLVTWAATLIFLAALGRYLGGEGFGVFFLALSVTGMFGTLIDFGMLPLVTREVARDPAQAARYLAHGLAIKLVLWIASLVAIQALAVLLGYPTQTRLVFAVFSLTIGVMGISNLLIAVYRGLERMAIPAVATIAEKVAVLALGVALLVNGGGVVAVSLAMLVGAALGMVVLLIPLAGQVRIAGAGRIGEARALLLAAAPFAVMAAVAQLYWRVDAVMLSKLADETVVGWYGASYRLFETLNFLPNIVATSVMVPVMARLSRQSQEATRTAFAKGLDLLLVAGIPLCVGLVVLAGPIIGFIYGEGFKQATPALRVLGVGLLVLYVNMAVSFALVSLDRERQLLFLPIGALVLNVALNLYLIPRYQHTGAAVATTISEAALTIAYFGLLPRALWPVASLRVAGRAAVAAGAMAAVLLVLGDLWLPALVGVGAAMYVLVGLAIRVVPAEDLAALGGALRRRSRATPAPDPA